MNDATAPTDAATAHLLSFVGATLIDNRPGVDEVNVPMIRHWVEAMNMPSAIHLDADAAAATGRATVVAPAAMTQAWVMRGYAATVDPAKAPVDGFADLIAALDACGYTSVVATDSDFTFERELIPGDRVSYTEIVDSISDEKTTGLGVGRFVTTTKTYRDAAGDVVASQVWRTLRFRPKASSGSDSGTATDGSAPASTTPKEG